MNYSEFMSFFLDFRKREFTQVWIGKKYAADQDPHPKEDTLFGAKHITTPSIHPCIGQDPKACTTVGNGPWTEKICHFLPQFQPSSVGDELQSEIFVPREHFRECLEIIHSIRDVVSPLL